MPKPEKYRNDMEIIRDVHRCCGRVNSQGRPVLASAGRGTCGRLFLLTLRPFTGHSLAGSAGGASLRHPAFFVVRLLWLISVTAINHSRRRSDRLLQQSDVPLPGRPEVPVSPGSFSQSLCAGQFRDRLRCQSHGAACGKYWQWKTWAPALPGENDRPTDRPTGNNHLKERFV